MTSTKRNSVRSDAARELMRQCALQRGEQRSAQVEASVRKAMKDIDKEIQKNGGIYPHNGGALSAAEVARRAGIHVTTLHKKLKALGNEVKDWLDLKEEKKELVGRVRVRRALSERLKDWQALYHGLEQSHRDTELQLQQFEAELEIARDEIRKLRDENEILWGKAQAALTERVVPLRRKPVK